MTFPFSRRLFLSLAASSAASPSISPFLRGAPIRAANSCSFIPRQLSSPALQKFSGVLAPGKDAFLCELYAAELEAIFDRLRIGLSSSPQNVSSLSESLAANVEFTPFDKFDSKPVRAGAPISIDNIEFAANSQRGSEQFLKSLASYLAPYARVTTAEFMLTGLHITAQSPLAADVTLRVNMVGQVGQAAREERTSIWSLACEKDSQAKWTIHRWLGTTETRVRVSGRGFVDVTAETMRGNDEAQRQFTHGVDYWRRCMDAAAGIDVYGNNGLAVGDFDGDGNDDIYICQPSGLPNRLLRNRGDGTFDDVTESSGLGLLDGTASALFADFTNSGTQDLIVVRTSGPLLYLNHGKGKFELKPDAFRFAKAPSGTFTGLAAADYNRDGLLDVYFCLYAYYQGLSQYTHPRPYYDAKNGPPNFLMRNRGDGTFEDVTAGSGMNLNNDRFTFACGWCDYDNDGWPDLYVANDFGRKNFYRNNGDGTFRDIASEAGVEDFGAGMSVSWFDCDNDGRQDLYVTDMCSAAGTRVTRQDAFLPGVDPSIRKAYQKHARGNSLFTNQGKGQVLLDESIASGVAMGRWSWSGDAWDFDHDGNTDLYVTNGFISGENREDLQSFFWRQIVSRSLENGGGALDYEQAWNAINELIRSDYSWNGNERNIFFLNQGSRRFADAAGALGLDFTDDSRAFVLADFDGDGRLEVVIKNRTAPQVRVLKNLLDPIGKSIAFRLHGTKSNRDAVGAKVTLHCGASMQTKFVQAGSGFLSQHTKDLHFGIGDEASPIRISILWPSGVTQQFENVPAQHLIRIEEGKSDFVAKAFSAAAAKVERLAANASRDDVESAGVWLVEPLPAPNFVSPASDGSRRAISDFKGKLLLLVLAGGDCEASRQQLTRLSTESQSFGRQGVEMMALYLDRKPTEGSTEFPSIVADAATSGTYGILYRYLFDRRRGIETPLHLLIDRNGAIFKVWSGDADPAALLKDFANASVSAEARLSRALPFRGTYHGETPRRNYFTYGIAYIQNEYSDAALDCFQLSIARDPNYAAAHYNIGTIYLNKQMLPEAKASLERAVALDPQDADALTNLGAVAGQQKDYDAAYHYFDEAVHVKPTHVVALQNLVMLDRWKGQPEKAQKNIERALAVDPNDPEFHFALGMLLAGQEKFEESRSHLERAAQLRPGDPITLNNLGVVFLRLNNPAEAFQCFSRCMKLAPDYDRPFLNIASIYQQQGQVAEAKQVLKEFLARHPDNAELAEALKTVSR